MSGISVNPGKPGTLLACYEIIRRYIDHEGYWKYTSASQKQSVALAQGKT